MKTAAFRAGQPGGLKARTPPIPSAEEEQAAEWQLVDLELGNGRTARLAVAIISAELTLRNAAGQSTRRHAEYQVTLSSPASVLRSDP